jgi:hypothetical protein
MLALRSRLTNDAAKKKVPRGQGDRGDRAT